MEHKNDIGDSSSEDKNAPYWPGYLADRETLLWQGRPAGGVRFSQEYILFFAMAILLFVFAAKFLGISFNPGEQAAEPSTFSKIAGYLAVLTGFYFLIGDFFYQAYKRSHSYYALTSKRAIIYVNLFRWHAKSYPINQKSRIVLIEKELSNVEFAEMVAINARGMSNRTIIAFEYIADGPEVYRLLKTVQRSPTEP